MSKVLEKWENYGFLEGIEEDKKPMLAVYYEELYNFFIMTENEGRFTELETTAFPLIRRVLEKTNFKYDKSVSEFVGEVVDIRNGHTIKKLENDLKHGFVGMVHIESELTHCIGEILVEKYGNV